MITPFDLQAVGIALGIIVVCVFITAWYAMKISNLLHAALVEPKE